MAQRLKSGKKRVRSSQKRKSRNLEAKLAIKKVFKAAEKAIVAKLAEADSLIKKAISILDKAAERGIVHKNKVARKKSRLQRKLNKSKA